MTVDRSADEAPPHPGGEVAPRLRPWRSAPVWSVAAASVASGFGQFGAVAALADVAEAFGETSAGASVAEQAGLSGTVLGAGLAVIRLASLGSIPLAALADRRGRTPVLVWSCAVGLALVVLGALSPGYWVFVAVFGLSRPFLSATNAVAQVVAGEHTSSGHRARAVALVSAGYGLGAALVAVVRGAAGGAVGFRATFALAAVPLVLLPLLRRWMVEPDRYRVADLSSPDARTRAVLGALDGEGRRRLVTMVLLALAAAFVTGPANSFVFVYAEGVLDVPPSLTAALLVAALPVGLAGLLLGRWGADRWGRRPTAALALAGIAGAAALTYRGGVPSTVAGSLAAVLAGYAFAPVLAAMGNELFPTRVRAAVAGLLVGSGVLGAVAGLMAFGALADLFDGFAAAAVVVAIPALAAATLFARLPETRGLELEESAPLRSDADPDVDPDRDRRPTPPTPFLRS